MPAAKYDEEEDSGEWYSLSKAKPPVIGGSTIDRPALIETLDAALSRHLTVLSAPAGFGKSTLLAQWCRHRAETGKLSGWLSLDESDSDPHQFISYFILALELAEVDIGQLAMAAQNGLVGTSIKLISKKLVDSVCRSPQQVLMVLDDYHRAQSAVSDQLMTELASRCRGRLHICLSSRNTPTPELAAYLATGNAFQIQANDLRFSDDEVRRAVGIELDEDCFGLLKRKAEGWPVAIQLAKLLIGGRDDLKTALSRLHGHTGHLAAYLTSQVIAKLDPELRDFMLRTSILDKFNASLADSVCHHTGSRTLIKNMEPLHALLIPIDDTQEWFRYHHLFAECLQDLLQQRHGGECPELHLRAAEWHSQRGLFTAAVRHARAAGRYDICADIICRAGGWELILFGGIGYLNNLLRDIPESVLQHYPRVQFAKSYLALKNGNIKEARAYFDAGVCSREFNRDDEKSYRDFVNLSALIDAYEDSGLIQPKEALLNEALDRIPSDDPITRGVVQCQLALRHTAFGNFKQSELETQKAMRSMRQGNSVLGLNYCYLHAGMNAFYTGRYQLALANYKKAGEMAEDNFGADSGLKYNAIACLNSILFWKGELDDAGLVELKRAMAYVSDHDGWFEVYAMGYDALFHHAVQSDADQDALDTIEQMQNTARTRGIERLEQLAQAFHLCLLLRQRSTRDAALKFEHIRQWSETPDTDPAEKTWLVEYFVDCACAEYCSQSGKISAALNHANRARRRVEAIKAQFHMLRALLLQAAIYDMGKRRQEAIDCLLPALDMGSRAPLPQPFRIRDIAKLLRATHDAVRGGDQNILLANFLTSILDYTKKQNPLLSDREIEVLEELAIGKLNKEIAHALDLAENTVKFHLKNIFKKLGVTRRMQAVAVAQSLDIID